MHLKEPVTPLVAPDISPPPRAEELVAQDEEPLESSWHRAEINLLIESLKYHWRGRTDFYAGGNMFIYYCIEQARTREYRGPDFFVVLGVDGTRMRKAWVVWEEDGRYPDVIVELLPPTRAQADKTVKKQLYEQTCRTPEYFCYDPDSQELLGWRLREGRYIPLEPGPQGWLWSERLQL
jgi:Uma2 family endonuclease